MAGKARRAAARQGELSRRRKRGQRGPSGAPANAPEPSQQPTNGGSPALAMEAAGAIGTRAAVPDPEPAPVPVTAVAPAQQAAAQPRGMGRQRGERPAAYNYVGAELRRIGALATVVVAALVAISFVL